MAGALVLELLARAADDAAKKLIAAIGQMVFNGGPSPDDLFDLDLCRRLGWTLSELDEQDAARVMTGLILQGTRDSLQNIVRFLESDGKQKPSEDDLETYEEVKRLMAETEDDG